MVLESKSGGRYKYKGISDDYIGGIFDQIYPSSDDLDDVGSGGNINNNNGNGNGRESKGNKNDDRGNPGSYAKNAPGSFEILKFVLFGLLIVSPCLRAIHLWHAGGGRIALRRSHDARVVGLEYVAPAENWFGGGFEAPDGERVHHRLTRLQVMDLPEIIYKKPVDDDDHVANDEGDNGEHVYDESDDVTTEVDADDNSNGDGSSNGSDKNNIVSTTIPDQLTPVSSEVDFFSRPTQQLPTSPERVISATAACLSTNPDRTDSNRASSSSSSSVGSKEELPPDEEQPVSFRTQRRLRAFTTTTCTTCSICIDEFEEGEKIRLLPLCGHAFHTDCILPWLKDRQGCCPLCKTSVLKTDESSSDNNDDEQRNENIDR